MTTKTKPRYKRRKLKKLPDKPSALIRLALRDLEAAEKARGVRILMEQWHKGSHPSYYSSRSGPLKEPCRVCFAGAVMRGSLGVSDDVTTSPTCFEDVDTMCKLYALNCFRLGEVRGAYQEMGRKISKKAMTLFNDVVVADYHRNPKNFKRDMRKLARQLAEIGE